ncbi:hypothetical protein ACSBPH_01670 [Microbacterium sp. F51-2R]|uniref:hypothetical protein n=1 Tax=Microbacterium sp. F51-2R TaxID=3445777 RepID=UPI003FA123EF
MALAHRLETEQKKIRPQFDAWLDSLSTRNHDIVVGWLNDPNLSNAAIIRMIADDDPDDDFKGYRANKDTVAEWRRRNGTR